MRNLKTGKLYVSGEMVKEDELGKVLAKMEFVPLRVEYLYVEDRFEYTGNSPLFDNVEIGMLVPEYHIKITKAEDGEIFVVAKKI